MKVGGLFLLFFAVAMLASCATPPKIVVAEFTYANEMGDNDAQDRPRVIRGTIFSVITSGRPNFEEAENKLEDYASSRDLVRIRTERTSGINRYTGEGRNALAAILIQSITEHGNFQNARFERAICFLRINSGSNKNEIYQKAFEESVRNLLSVELIEEGFFVLRDDGVLGKDSGELFLDSNRNLLNVVCDGAANYVVSVEIVASSRSHAIIMEFEQIFVRVRVFSVFAQEVIFDRDGVAQSSQGVFLTGFGKIYGAFAGIDVEEMFRIHMTYEAASEVLQEFSNSADF